MRFVLKYCILLFLVSITILCPGNLCGQVSHAVSDSLRKVFNICNVDSEKVNILLSLSEATDCADSNEKLNIANEAYTIAQKLRWDAGRLKCNMALGNYYFTCAKNYPKAIEYFQNGVYLAQTLRDTASEVKELESIAESYSNLGQYDQALEYYNKVLSLNTNADVNIGVLGNLGILYNSIGDYAQALECYNRSLRVLDESLGSKKVADSKYIITRVGLILYIGDIYLSMLQVDKALDNYNSAGRISRSLQDRFFQYLSLMSVGKAYFIQKDYRKAITNLESALAGYRSLNQSQYEAIILGQLADAYIAIGDISRANELANASLKITESENFIAQYPKTYITLSKLLVLKNDYTGAVNYLQNALAYSQKSQSLEDEKSAWEELGNAYEKMGQSAKALVAYRHFITLRDSLYNIDKAKELVRIDLQAGFGRKQLADSLKQVQKSRALELKVQRQKGITYGVFIGLVLVALLSFFMYRNYETQKKYNKLLSKEKVTHLAYIEEQSNVLTDIAHIQSHDIRGPVSTLLGLVKVFNFDDPNDPDNKEVIEGIAAVTERLDKIVTDVITKENKFISKGKFFGSNKK